MPPARLLMTADLPSLHPPMFKASKPPLCPNNFCSMMSASMVTPR